MEDKVIYQTETELPVNPHYPAQSLEENRGMESWEILAISLTFVLIAFFAIPRYFDYLNTVRGRESANRLTLIANCLKYLADQNQTQPGAKICELFDLNETLELAQRAIYSKLNISAERASFLKLGAEPDCPGGGDYVVNLFLDANGKIVEPTCTLVAGSKGDYYRKRGLYVADMSKVDGKIGIRSSTDYINQ